MAAGIPLGPWSRPQQGGGGASDVLGMVGKAMEIRNTQQQWMANQRMGQIWHTSPDEATAMATAEKDPMFPWMADAIRSQSQIDELNAQATSANYTTGMDAFQSVARSSITDGPEAALRRWDLVSGGLTPGARAATYQLGKDIFESHMDDLPTDPTQRNSAYAMRMRGTLLGMGMPADSWYQAVAGTPAPAWHEFVGPGGAQEAGVFGGGAFGAAAGTQTFQNMAQYGQPEHNAQTMGDGNTGLETNPHNVTNPPGAGLSEFGPGGLVYGMGPTIGQQKYAQGMGQFMSDYTNNLNERVNEGTQMMMSLGEVRGLLNQFKPGAGADVRQQLSQFAQGINAPQWIVDEIDNGNLGAKQAFTKFMMNNVMSLIQSTIPAGSRLTEREWDAFRAANPTITSDPRAVDKVLDFWTQTYVKDRLQQNYFQKYRDEGGDPTNWPAEWTMLGSQRGLFNAQKFVEHGPQKGKEISAENLAHLLTNDSPEVRQQFDSYYQDPGEAERFLDPGYKRGR